MVSGTVYHILLPILIDGSTTSPNMSRGTKSSYLQSSSTPLPKSNGSKTGDYPLRLAQYARRIGVAYGKASEGGPVFQLDTGKAARLPTKTRQSRVTGNQIQSSKTPRGQALTHLTPQTPGDSSRA